MVQTELIKRSDIEENKWNDFINSSPQNCIYLNSWYLDAVCDDWKAIIVSKDDQWVAVMPINSKTKLSVHYLLQPHFTQFMGVAYAGDLKFQKRPYEDYKVILKSICALIPENAKLINFNFHPSIEYLLPFHWAGFELRVRYSYWLDLENPIEDIRSNYSKSLKNELKLASKHQLTCNESTEINELVGFLKKREIISEDGGKTLQRLWDQVIQNKKGFVLLAKDENNQTQGAAAFMMDGNRLVYFQGSTAGSAKNGVNTFLIDQAILMAKNAPIIKYFDFEGSMIESIEHYFRSFKPGLKTYHSIYKNNLPSWMKISLDVKKRLSNN